MDVAHPILDVVPGPRGRVLDALARLIGSVTGRELAALAGVPTATTARVLADLVEAGIVEVVPVGRSRWYSLNREHLASRAIGTLAGVRSDLVEELRNAIERWDIAPVEAWLFGSTARGDGSRNSDVDLLVVAPHPSDRAVWEAQVGALATSVERWTGNRAQIVEHTIESLRAIEAEGSPFVRSVRREGISLAAVDGHGCRQQKSVGP